MTCRSYCRGRSTPGPTGPTGPAGTSVALLGIRQVTLPDANPGLLTLTEADFVNVTHPAARYFGLQFIGGLAEATVNVVLPKPATLDDAYFLDVENVSNGVSIALETEEPATGHQTFIGVASPGPSSDTSWRSATDAAIALAPAQAYRFRVQVRPDGVWQVPGYFAVAIP